jgi:predicted O-linked N-acetylglucosamine transferase (SPINDLY family)
VTTGIPTIDYFISWGAAELPTAQAHYREKLLLLDADAMHQYYEPRLDAAGRSKETGMPAAPYDRSYFAVTYGVPIQRRWYCCMQLSFKLHPAFDAMVLGILKRDPQGILIVMRPKQATDVSIFEQRWKACWSQVHYLPLLPHHELMGLYLQADVVLDSYYAGGCTTTREALEVGAPVVTLPGKYLGGRWSAAYYRQMGYEALVARDPQHYVELALQVGPEHRQAILATVGKLFYRTEAVDSWMKVLETCVT